MDKTLDVVVPDRAAASICEACGESFGCGAALSTCWCREVQVSAEVRADLQEQYTKCLCPRCLARAAGTQAVGPS